MTKVTAGWLRFYVLILFLWSVFGVAVSTMIVYGVFDNVAMAPPVMAAAIGTGTAIFATLMGFAMLGVVKRVNRALSGRSL